MTNGDNSDPPFDAEEGTVWSNANAAVSESAGASLPHPEELKGRANFHDGRKNKPNKCLAALLLVVVVAIAMVVVFTVGLEVGESKKERGSTSGTGSDTGGKALPPSDNGDGDGGSSSSSDSDRTFDMVGFLVEWGVSDRSDLESPSTPQNRAASWIAHALGKDDYDLVKDAHRYVQRYVLAVVYYSLGGEEWLDQLSFLSQSSECDWNVPLKDRNGRYVNMGVMCDSDGQVTRLWTPRDNGLLGTIPEEIRFLTYLETLALPEGMIVGTIPESIGHLKKLRELAFSDNKITGIVPTSFENLVSLETLALDGNDITGSPLHTLRFMKNLSYVYLEDNDFQEDIISLIPSELKELRHLDLSGNQFTGILPPIFFNHPRLEVLDLHDNQIGGFFPSEIGLPFEIDAFLPGEGFPENALIPLRYVALHKNALRGVIPAEISNLQELEFLDLSRNQFAGYLPDSIGTMTKLEKLYLGDNLFFQDELPHFFENMTSLMELSLKGLKYTGTIHNFFGNLKDLFMLDLDGNDLTGNIPASLGNLTGLFILMLNRNRLSGSVPESLANLTNLDVLLLDNNDLTGNLNFMCPSSLDSTMSNGETRNKIDFLLADCGGEDPEVDCEASCCTLCCEDNVGRLCLEDLWRINNKPNWEHGYKRMRFTFDM